MTHSFLFKQQLALKAPSLLVKCLEPVKLLVVCLHPSGGEPSVSVCNDASSWAAGPVY